MSDEENTRARNAELRGALSPQKQALLEKRLRGKPSAGTDGAIRPAAGDRPSPLSHPQQRLWFVQQFDPSATWYNRPTLLCICGGLDIPRLEQALTAVISRHAILHTAYPLQDGQPQARLLPFSAVHLDQEDLQAMNPRQVQERIQTAIRQPFDLANGPLVQLHLFRLGQDEYQLLFVTHHIAFDRWSEDVLIRELDAAYRDSDMSDLPIQYSDFATWQRSPEHATRLAPHLAYWQAQLSGQLPVLELPSDHPHPAVQDLHGDAIRLSLPEGLLVKLKEVARSNDSTLYMLLLAAFNVLLYRYTGQTDLLVGSPIAGRTRPELEGLIGCFINNLVLRTDLSGNPPFDDLLACLRKLTLDAYQHQEVPFELLVEVLKPVRDLGRTPLFQVMFNFENTPPGNPQQGLPVMTRLELDETVALYDLSVSLSERDGSLTGDFIYPTALFERETIQRMTDHYLVLLEGIAADPHQSIGSLPILTGTERERMLKTWNAATAPYPADACLHQLFEHWAQETPHELAVVLKDQKLTYAVLDERADKIAIHLSGLGVEPERKVALFMDRCPEMIVAMLGILKAGGTYVPLDPALPKERLSYLLADSRSMLVLSQGRYTGMLGGLGPQVVCYEEVIQSAGQAGPVPQVAINPDNLAYIMYTSGSTGQPKGVMITHHNVVGFLYGYREVTRDGPHRVGTSVAPFNFDTSVEEIFANLCFGGTLHIILPEDSTNPAWFASYLLEQGITTTYIVPDFLPEIAHNIKDLGVEKLKLKCLITGLAPKKECAFQPWRELLPGLRILNAYGPTEVTYGATAFEFKEMKDPQHDVPIGAPFPNYQVYIVDANLQPVPVGVTGELLIGGVGVSRGYYHRPELTAERFIPDPFSGIPGSRLYRSGDLVRYLPDGNIEFLGRADDQVKLRGYRIELGEIESHLVACPLVHKCLVLAREILPGDLRLVAYVIPASGASPTASELRQYLAGRLPVYMLPNHFILLEAFPLMINGKVNRTLLPLPDQEHPKLEQVFVPPSTPTEHKLAEIWSKLLGVERIGIHDNFFELGGHSMLAIRLIADIEKQMGVRLSLNALFESPTIRQIVWIIEGKGRQPGRMTLVAIQAAGKREPLFLVPPSATTAMKFDRLAKFLGKSQPVYGFNHLGLDGIQEPQDNIFEMADLYVREMTAFKPQGPYLLGGMCFGAQVALQMAHQLEQNGKKAVLVVLLDPGRPFKEPNKESSLSPGKEFPHIFRGTFFKRLGNTMIKIIRRYKRLKRRARTVQRTNITHKKAMRKHQTMPYPGRVIFFQSPFRKEHLASLWGDILTGAVDYIVIPNSTHKSLYLKDEHLQTIANILSKNLDEFQERD
jgi:amino acid adenylation domain-containing protein